MAIFDQVEGSIDADVSWVRAVDRALRHAAPPQMTLEMEVFARDVAADPGIIRSRRTPPLGIHAVALVQRGDGWVPGVLVMTALAPDATFESPSLLADQSRFAEVLAELAVPAGAEAVVVGIQSPSDSYAQVVSTMYGTAGVPVRLPDGRSGILTAGHVAATVGATAHVGPVSGEVVYSNHRGRHPFPTMCADVAVIALDPDWRLQISPPDLHGTAQVGQLDLVGAKGLSGVGTPARPVRALGESFAITQAEGCWGDFILTDAISVEGDSGSVAHDPVGAVVGQVVGGLQHGYSIIQQIDYLLIDAGVELDI